MEDVDIPCTDCCSVDRLRLGARVDGAQLSERADAREKVEVEIRKTKKITKKLKEEKGKKKKRKKEKKKRKTTPFSLVSLHQNAEHQLQYDAHARALLEHQQLQ